MKYIEKNKNVERVYSVHYDSEKLKELLDEVVRNLSYRTDGHFNPLHIITFDGNVITSGANLPNGDPEYENIKKIEYYNYQDDSIRVVGTKVTSPRLAFIIKKILSDDEKGIYEFLDYKNASELIPIDEQIVAANKAIDEIDNFDFNKKMSALNELKSLCAVKENKQYFDVELLKQYYLQAYSLIELELISEKTMMSGNRVLLKDFKSL